MTTKHYIQVHDLELKNNWDSLSLDDRIVKIEECTVYLKDFYGLKNWKVELKNTKKSLGHCEYNTKTISISRHMKNYSYDENRDVILHEIAHALCTHDDGHGDVWKTCAKDIGCTGNKCANIDIVKLSNYKITCPCLVNNFYRIRLTKKMKQSKCGKCKGLLKIEKIN